MAVGGRHIRHDWKTFVDWEQVSVRTICGSTTKRHLAGIPGLTPQPVVVQTEDKKVSGWCVRCAYSTYLEADRVISRVSLPNQLVDLYTGVRLETSVAYEAYRDRLVTRGTGQYK